MFCFNSKSACRYACLRYAAGLMYSHINFLCPNFPLDQGSSMDKHSMPEQDLISPKCDSIFCFTFTLSLNSRSFQGLFKVKHFSSLPLKFKDLVQIINYSNCPRLQGHSQGIISGGVCSEETPRQTRLQYHDYSLGLGLSTCPTI